MDATFAAVMKRATIADGKFALAGCVVKFDNAAVEIDLGEDGVLVLPRAVTAPKPRKQYPRKPKAKEDAKPTAGQGLSAIIGGAKGK